MSEGRSQAPERRRADRRFLRRILVEFTYQGVSQSGHTRDLSLGGAFIETDLKLAFGARLLLRFRLPHLEAPLEVAAQVRWCDSGDEHAGVGVRFDGLRAQEVWALGKFFEPPP
jgi:uncharacterized protein (TIGR02266 family)